MIISASRRTDIPSYYSDWFMNRIREGYVLVRNPMRYHQVSNISLSPEAVDGIVFWTKNPLPILDKLNPLHDYTYYFQFTITPYGTDIEPHLPSKSELIIPAFQRLSDQIGPERVIWRYDPILLNEKYSISYHLRAFERFAQRLCGYTSQCTISFIDHYRKNAHSLAKLGLEDISTEKMLVLGRSLAEIAHHYGYRIDTCAEKVDLEQFGVGHARCVDDRLLGKLRAQDRRQGRNPSLRYAKDKNQRLECGCVASVDIGVYNSCQNGCKYCYANFSDYSVRKDTLRHNPDAPLLLGEIEDGDVVKERNF